MTDYWLITRFQNIQIILERGGNIRFVHLLMQLYSICNVNSSHVRKTCYYFEIHASSVFSVFVSVDALRGFKTSYLGHLSFITQSEL